MRMEAATRALFAQDAEQQVLGADVVVQQPVGFLGGELQHALGFGAERNLDRGRDLLAEDRAAFDFLADVFEGEVRAREDPARQPFAFANQAEQEVLGLNRDAAELAGLIAGEEENPSRPFRVAFEHPACLRVRGLVTMQRPLGRHYKAKLWRHQRLPPLSLTWLGFGPWLGQMPAVAAT